MITMTEKIAGLWKMTDYFRYPRFPILRFYVENHRGKFMSKL